MPPARREVESERPRGEDRLAKERSAPAKAGATKAPTAAASAERREGNLPGGSIARTGEARKTLDREVTVVAVDATSNGKVVDTKLQTKPPQRAKAQAASEESAVKAEKTGAAAVSGAKATETNTGPIATPKAAAPSSAKQKSPAKDEAAAASKSIKAGGQRQGFKLNEFVVYPAHGVGQIVSVEEQEVAGFKLELFVISFSKDKMTLRVPTSKVAGVGMRKISDPETAKRSLDILSGRARVKRTMWSRRAQEYETKINSGDIAAIAEVVRDLYRSDAQPEQSYSERQLYEAALDRMVREIAAVQKSNEIDALKAIEAQLQKAQSRQPRASGAAEAADPEIEEAA